MYIHVHVLCHFNKCSYIISDINGGGTTVEVSDVSGTEANVQGLTPGALYTFSVTSENAVSSQDNDINSRTANTLAITREGGEGEKLMSVFASAWLVIHCHHSGRKSDILTYYDVTENLL